MSDLIGRFLSFEEHLGRGLVKFTYYLALFMLVVMFAWVLLKDLFGWNPGDFIVHGFQFLLCLMGLRVGSEILLAILSIDDRLQSGGNVDGFEAGLTPAASSAPAAAETAATPGTTVTDAPLTAEQSDASSEKPAKKSGKKAKDDVEAAPSDADDDASSDD